MMNQAKGKEVKEFIKENVITRLTEGEYVDPKQIMRMRFILTWKKDSSVPEGKRGKARLVVLGFEDPFLGEEQVSSPTLNKRSKQILLQTVCQRGWELEKGDVTAAFLQGKKLDKCKYCLAPPELCEALNLTPGERVVRLLKSVYGLTTAPIEWFKAVNETLEKLGGHSCACDPCVWTFSEWNNKTQKRDLIGIIGCHVDDFLIAGNTKNERWNKIKETLLTSFRWTPFEKSKFKQCGVQITQTEDGGFDQEQHEYLTGLCEIPLTNERKKQKTSPVTEKERTELRGLLGALQWLVGQTRPDGNIDVNLLQSQVTKATVDTLLEGNKILRKLRQNHEVTLRTRKIEGEIIFIAWSDASWANRKDGNSTGGFVIGCCDKKVLEGHKTHTTIISWSTNRLKRVARSSLSAEVQALSNAEDELHLVRACWAEFNALEFDLNNADEDIGKIAGAVIIDAKSIYDTLTSNNQPLQLAEKRTAIELLAYIRNTERNNTITRWVHGEANLADSLTKQGASQMLWEFLKDSRWSIVFDEKQMSGKKRRKAGMSKLENSDAEETKEPTFNQLVVNALKTVWPQYVEESETDEEYPEEILRKI